jgi:hypothetical protein
MSDRPATLIPLRYTLALVGAVLVLSAFEVVLPCLSGSRKSILVGVVNNLVQIDRAKQEWAAEHRATNGSPVSEADLARWFPRHSKVVVVPVVAETYSVNPIGVLPEARLSKAVGRYTIGTVLRLGKKGLEMVVRQERA